MNLLQAKKAIASILCEYEKSTGEIVDQISINKTDVTQLGDDRQKYQMDICIHSFRPPGNYW